MATDAYSGKTGTAKKGGVDLPDVGNWVFTPTANEDKFASNKTGGHKVVVPGVEDFTGTVTCKLPANSFAPFHIGDAASLQLHVNDSGNDYIAVEVVILSGPIECDVNDGNTVETQYGFGPTAAPVYHGRLHTSGTPSSGV